MKTTKKVVKKETKEILSSILLGFLAIGLLCVVPVILLMAAANVIFGS
jgi:hypothetical protein